MSGKGDGTRPRSVPRDTFAANWHRTFNDSRTIGHGEDARGSYRVLLTEREGGIPVIHADRLIEFNAAPEATDAEA